MQFENGSAAEAGNGFEISSRFRRMIENRVARLELDAANDEAMVPLLESADHIRRQRHLVAAQRAEAERMRRFLDDSRTRDSSPMIPL